MNVKCACSLRTSSRRDASAAVDYCYDLGLGSGAFQIRNPIPLKIHRVWGLLIAKSCVLVKRPPAGVVRKLGKGSECRPGHLTGVQNYEVRPKMGIVLLQKGTLI
ncbi:hypothetical protein AVEN_243725-1 [Araneus ventricosus]|uniref:Uncharacterized protein n=1 Tax=Araneus ventricosus TaxID=182803 RepID=A0A4Y2A5R2_ARAVE|nr:hypothetical protein AVEN_243725-1 [Araneus ventricosus]